MKIINPVINNFGKTLFLCTHIAMDNITNQQIAKNTKEVRKGTVSQLMLKGLNNKEGFVINSMYK